MCVCVGGGGGRLLLMCVSSVCNCVTAGKNFFAKKRS